MISSQELHGKNENFCSLEKQSANMPLEHFPLMTNRPGQQKTFSRAGISLPISIACPWKFSVGFCASWKSENEAVYPWKQKVRTLTEKQYSSYQIQGARLKIIVFHWLDPNPTPVE